MQATAALFWQGAFLVVMHLPAQPAGKVEFVVICRVQVGQPSGLFEQANALFPFTVPSTVVRVPDKRGRPVEADPLVQAQTVFEATLVACPLPQTAFISR